MTGVALVRIHRREVWASVVDPSKVTSRHPPPTAKPVEVEDASSNNVRVVVQLLHKALHGANHNRNQKHMDKPEHNHKRVLNVRFCPRRFTAHVRHRLDAPCKRKKVLFVQGLLLKRFRGRPALLARL